MSHLWCSDCGELFDAKDGNEWRDIDGEITCWKCLEIEEEERDRDIEWGDKPIIDEEY